MGDQTFFVTLVTIELLIPNAHSLKEKRKEIRGLKDRIRGKFNAAVAEVGYQDKWQRCALAVCLVGSDKRLLESNFAKIHNLCVDKADVEIVNIDHQWL